MRRDRIARLVLCPQHQPVPNGLFLSDRADVLHLRHLFPSCDRPILGAIVQISPFFHGVSLLQMAAWNQFSPRKIFYHLGVIFAYALVLGLWSLVRIRKIGQLDRT